VKLRDKKLLHQGHHEWHHLPSRFLEIYQLVQKLLVGDTQPDRLVVVWVNGGWKKTKMKHA
jgi:hypothetical protein